MKRIVLAVLAVVLVLCAGGCSTPAAGGETPENRQTAAASSEPAGSVSWLNYDPQADGALHLVASLYTAKTGVPVEIITPRAGTYPEVLKQEMESADPPTLFVISSQADLAEWGEKAVDLTGTDLASERTTDIYDLTTPDGKLAATGYAFDSFGILVNMDLLAKAGHHVSEIRDFATLSAVVQDIHGRSSELGFDAFTSNPLSLSSSWRYAGHLANIDYYYEQDGTMWTETPPSITGAYLPNYRNLYDLAINNSLTAPAHLATGTQDPVQEFHTGMAAFCLDGSWSWDDIRGTVPNATLLPYYCGVPGEEKAAQNCGTMGRNWAVNAAVSEEDQQATLDFMYWCVTDPEASAILVETYGAMPYTNAAVPGNDLLAAAHQYAKEGRYVMNWAYVYQPNVDVYRTGLVDALMLYVQDQSDANWQLFVDAFVDGWAEQYQAVHG